MNISQISDWQPALVSLKERPILFKGEMVRAIQEGRKTQTRRLNDLNEINESPGKYYISGTWVDGSDKTTVCFADLSGTNTLIRCPYGKPNDYLWVRETWAVKPSSDLALGGRAIAYAADYGFPELAKISLGFKWKPSIHMKRCDSRLTLEILDVRVERLQEITEEGARAEGVGSNGQMWRDYTATGDADPYTLPSARESFRSLWESINGADSWDANPWVFVVEFKKAPETQQEVR